MQPSEMHVAGGVSLPRSLSLELMLLVIFRAINSNDE